MFRSVSVSGPARALVLTLGLLGLSWLAADAALAQNVDLDGATADTIGVSKLKAEGETCSNFASLDVEFLPGRKWRGVDAEGRVFKGSYKQSGTDGRALAVKLTSKSKNKLEKAVKALTQFCFGTNDVKVDLSDIQFKGKVNDTFDGLTVKGNAKVKGEVDGQNGEGKYILKVSGPLALAGPI